uniref:Fibronectin type III and SPRY domain containing 2 n=1 Tax=Latimeria chalumnae TaxID=7897 RepID=H3BEX0_LATCH
TQEDAGEKEPEGLTFYHMDLYESQERLDIFAEEQAAASGRTDQFDITEYGEFKRGEQDLGFSQTVGDIYAEDVEELARQYGLTDDKEIEMELPTESPLDVFKRRHEQYNEQYQIPEQDYIEQDIELNSFKTTDKIPEYISSGEDFLTSREMEQYQHIYTDVDTREMTHLKQEIEIQATTENEIPDVFCVVCKVPIRAFDKLFGPHKDHEVAQLDKAVEDEKVELHTNMCKLEEQIAQMENFASHLEEIFITVEENFGRQEQNLEQHYNEVMQILAQRYEEKIQGLGEEKKQKLETLYGHLVNCGKALDTSKELTETTQELCKEEDKVTFLKNAVATMDRLEEFFKTDDNMGDSTIAEFQNCTIDFSDVKQLMDSINTVPAPSAPVINPQNPNSATSTSVRVCWSLFSDDTVECYQLYYKQVIEDTTGEEQNERMVKVKETYCTVNDLVPNTQYEFWVTALNTTGISPASERAVYMTVPSPPIVKCKECRSCQQAALICWESGNTNPVDSYTVELCKLTNEENESVVTESIVGVPTCESLIQLQSGQSYIIYVRAVNVGGPSERSQPVTIHTTGTFFHLNEDTAHPLLVILEDGFTIAYNEEESISCDLSFNDNSFTNNRCIAIMGSLIPVRGKHYWEIEVDETTEYRVGVAFEDTQKNGYLGGNNTSWCMRHIITPSRHKYEFLHNGSTPDVRITDPPKRVGILLDYDTGRLSFFNSYLCQHLFTFKCQFQHFVHPCFALEKSGVLQIRNGIAAPEYVKFT